jgi:glycosyltransferase involved in cell wall biosynthesis
MQAAVKSMEKGATPAEDATLRVMFWGTYDLSKPRNRILREGLRRCGARLEECHARVWEDVRDKAVLSRWHQTGRLLKVLAAYPRLILGFLRSAEPDLVLLGYLGQLDVLVLWPFARWRGVPVVWDQFISLYNTVVEDRRALSPRNPLARILYAWEWLACRAADRVLMDTRAHADYVRRLYALPPEKVDAVWVGVESEQFPPPPLPPVRGDLFTVLFYGQLIPLHGVETIIKAARLLGDAPVRFVFIGSGQEEARVRRLLEEEPLDRLEWIPWVRYGELAGWIHSADVCLGIFGATEKAALVIPNKVFQILSAGRPLITRDSPAIRELLDDRMPGVTLVPPADPAALAAAIEAISSPPTQPQPPRLAELRARIGPGAIGEQALAVLRSVARRSDGSSTT